MDNDSRYLSAEEQTRELTRSITREVGKLSEQWNQLIDHSDNWKHSLDEFMTVSSSSISQLPLQHLFLSSIESQLHLNHIDYNFNSEINCIH